MGLLYNQRLNNKPERALTTGELAGVAYHDIFDYPLTPPELAKWAGGNKARLSNLSGLKIRKENGYLFIKGRSGLVLKRLMRERVSAKKLAIARKVAKIISFIPSIKMVAVTGALAMKNADEGSDIDLMIVTKKGALWTTRLLTVLLLDTLGIARRKYDDRTQKDKLCLNIWLDEDDLVWRKRNIFTAHEIAHIIPLVNRGKTYKKFILENIWIEDYWPNSVKILSEKDIRILRPKNKTMLLISKVVEPLAFKLQYLYMKSKITRETVTPTRALFHPLDLGSFVISKLKPHFN